MTVVMKIDLVGPKRRGFALGLNEAAGYGGVAAGGRAQRLARRRVRGARRARRRRLRRRARRRWLISVALRPRHRRPRRPRAGAPPRRRRAGAAAARRLPATPPTACRRCAPARRPAWSTTSTTRSPGGWSRSSSPPHGASIGRDRAGRRPLPGGLGRRADLDRPLVGPRRPQAADRRRDADPGRGARAAGRLGRTRRRGRRRRGRARRRHGARLPDPDRGDLRRRHPGRPGPDRRRLPLLARHGLRGRRPVRRPARRRDRLGGAIAVVAGLTALSGLWVAVGLPGTGARRSPLPRPTMAKP